MHINCRWLLFLLLSTCLLVSVIGKGGGRGGGFRSGGGYRSGSSTRSRPHPAPPARPPPVFKLPPIPTSRPPVYRPLPVPAPKSTPRPQPPPLKPTQRPSPLATSKPTQRPTPPATPKPTPKFTPKSQPPSPKPTQRPTPKPSAPEEFYRPKQPATNPNFKQQNPSQKSASPRWWDYSHFPGGIRPYPSQPLGGNVWQANSGKPVPAYMNFGGIPTGGNINAISHKQKGFLGSLISLVPKKKLTPEKYKYYGSYPSPYRVGGGAGQVGNTFLGRHANSAAMYTILPYMPLKKIPQLTRPTVRSQIIFLPRPYYRPYYYEDKLYPRYTYYDMYDDNYAGECRRPLKKEHADIRCKATHDDMQCHARCESGYEFPNNKSLISSWCWHVTGVWRPSKNFPDCKPTCKCLNGGKCIRPNVCKCLAKFRGSWCQFNSTHCNVLKLTKKGLNLGWVCTHTKNRTECKIRCKTPTEFESPAADVYTCEPNVGKWTPASLPRCIVRKIIEDSNSTAL